MPHPRTLRTPFDLSIHAETNIGRSKGEPSTLQYGPRLDKATNIKQWNRHANSGCPPGETQHLGAVRSAELMRYMSSTD